MVSLGSGFFQVQYVQSVLVTPSTGKHLGTDKAHLSLSSLLEEEPAAVPWTHRCGNAQICHHVHTVRVTERGEGKGIRTPRSLLMKREIIRYHCPGLLNLNSVVLLGTTNSNLGCVNMTVICKSRGAAALLLGPVSWT